MRTTRPTCPRRLRHPWSAAPTPPRTVKHGRGRRGARAGRRSFRARVIEFLRLGFAGAFRRSELVSLDLSDLEFLSSGLVVTLRKSKTGQEGASRRISIPFGSTDHTCRVWSLKEWLESARIV